MHIAVHNLRCFRFLSDCGIHNSKQIVLANFDLIIKILDLTPYPTDAIKSKMIENSLEDCVSAFDGYAREHCSKIYNKISFQNIDDARGKLLTDRGVDLSEGLEERQWLFIVEQFQKRHLLAHKMGIIDQEYIKKTNSSPSLLGRKVSISESEVRELVKNLKEIGRAHV